MTASDGKTSRDDVQGREEEGFLRRWVKRKAEARSGDPDAAEASTATDPGEVDSAEAPESVRPIETEAPAQPARREAPEPSDADMPPLDSLDQDSDYSPFLSRSVSPELRQTALRQLFRQPKFNVETCLDDFQDDFLNFQPLGDIVTADMRHMAEVEAKREATRVARAADATPSAEPSRTAEGQAREDGAAPAPGDHAEADADADADAAGPADAGAMADTKPPGATDGASPPDQTRMKS